jgi:hypothetical protein
MKPLLIAGRALALFAVLLLPLGAIAQSDVLITGSMHALGTNGHDETLTFECRGTPTCTGTVKVRIRFGGCTNYLEFTSTFTLDLATVNLAQSGTYSGTVIIAPVGWENVNSGNGICTVTFQHPSAAIPYTVSWNATTATGTGTFVTEDGPSETFTFNADIVAPPPVFPMVVQSQINANTATASANIQFRPQDVGQSGGVFTFASAPATQVQGGLQASAMKLGNARMGNKADAPCVLAQVSPSGQLVAVSAAQLQAAVTGTFSAQGASLSILDNVPTPRVAGATFYVGYGSNGSAMLDNGIFRNAVLVPGSSTCPPLPYMTSLWWNPSESGWGLNLNQQGSTMFGTLFTYDASRAPLWLVMPGGTLQADGVTFAGDLYRTTGPAFNANPFTPIGAANITRVGSMTVSFTQANAGTLTYSVNGVEVQKYIQRQVFGSRSANCLPSSAARGTSTHYQDLWWNANESGWGLNLTHQDNTFFATLFTYDASGRDLWLVMPAGTRQGDGSYLGDLYRTTGSAFNTLPFPPIAGSDVTAVGNMRLRFTNGNAGTLTYVYNGTTVTKAITRQEFSTPLSACN